MFGDQSDSHPSPPRLTSVGHFDRLLCVGRFVLAIEHRFVGNVVLVVGEVNVGFLGHRLVVVNGLAFPIRSSSVASSART